MLRLNEPQAYQFHLRESGEFCLTSGAVRCKFASPASQRGVAKLYTVSQDRMLIYVGITEQSMSARLNSGLKANGKGGYHGYKWKSLRVPLTLFVWTANGVHLPAQLTDLQIVEAEVAFCCRRLSGQWPAYQHEIHFSRSSACHRAAAKAIYERSRREA